MKDWIFFKNYALQSYPISERRVFLLGNFKLKEKFADTVNE